MTINWHPLHSEADIELIKTKSKETPCLIFKHSTRCNLSGIAKYRLESDWDFAEDRMKAYFLDLIQYKSLSNQIADTFQVFHESPQVLLIINEECVYDASHLNISIAELKEALDLTQINNR